MCLPYLNCNYLTVRYAILLFFVKMKVVHLRDPNNIFHSFCFSSIHQQEKENHSPSWTFLCCFVLCFNFLQVFGKLEKALFHNMISRPTISVGLFDITLVYFLERTTTLCGAFFPCVPFALASSNQLFLSESKPLTC